MLRFLTRHLYLLAVGGGALSFTAARIVDAPLEAAVLGWSLATLALGIALERLAPFDPLWARSHGDTAVDATSAAVLIGAVDPLLKAALPLAAVALLSGIAAPTAWPLADAPLALQIGSALLWIEFAKYWSHRIHHEHPALWWLHALHHGSTRLYWLNNLRFHPLNYAINTTVALLPLLLVGAPQEALLGALAIAQPVMLLQHLNARTDNGWLNRVFSTNEVHRWHHSADPAEAHANFGGALVLFDQLFGTYRPAAAHDRPRAIGLFGNGAGYPARASYLHQLIAPLLPPCCRPA